MAEENYQALQFAPFSSCVNPGFWSAFSKVKLEVLGLDETPVNAVGSFANSTPTGVAPILNLDWDALKENNPSSSTRWDTYLCQGQIFNLNTIEAFKSCDKVEFLRKRCTDDVWAKICDGSALDKPSLLNTFAVLMFSDLKKYHYYYWFAFPSFALPASVKVHKKVDKITSIYTQSQCDKICQAYGQRKKDNLSETVVFGVVLEEGGDHVTLVSLAEALKENTRQAQVAIVDPSSLETHPGWPLRNLLALLCKAQPDKLKQGLDVICFRQHVMGESRKLSIDNSLVFKVKDWSSATELMTGIIVVVCSASFR